MKRFIKNSIYFSLLLLIVGELVVRLTHSVSDIPQRVIDNSGIQKYSPNQSGYWKGGNHKWNINELGWPGELPSSYNNLVTIIGDSFIENFMNPNECHQAAFLKERLSNYNFLEASRSGVSLIEAMEISKQTDTLKPVSTLIYLNNNDFYESISNIRPISNITQINLNTNTLKFGVLNAPKIKKILYNCKLAYYLYNRFPLVINKNNKEIAPDEELKLPINKHDDMIEIVKLIKYISENYSIENKTLVFHPNSDKKIIEACKIEGFNTIILDSSNDKSWTFDYDKHWTCYGHKKVADQVILNLTINNLAR